MKNLGTLLIIGLLNFGALGLGGLLMDGGPTSDWYMALQKAPWTPAGWVFGAAWTLIMFCFTIYMTRLWYASNRSKSVLFLFAIQWVLNVMWNPVFFKFHLMLIGLVIILMLTALVIKFLFGYWRILKLESLWILPYALWLLVATSLNAYIYFYN